MAEVAPVLFSGGKCAGRTETRLLSDLRDGRVSCLNQRYDAHEVEPGYWLAVLPGVKVNPNATGATAHNATRAWNRAMHAMNVTLPNHLARAKQSRLALLRSTRR